MPVCRGVISNRSERKEARNFQFTSLWFSMSFALSMCAYFFLSMTNRFSTMRSSVLFGCLRVMSRFNEIALPIFVSFLLVYSLRFFLKINIHSIWVRSFFFVIDSSEQVPNMGDSAFVGRIPLKAERRGLFKTEIGSLNKTHFLP